MRVLNRSEQRHLLGLMGEGMGIASMARYTGHSTTTVRRYIARFGEALVGFHRQTMSTISPHRVECDETWSFVYAKERKNIKENSKNAPPSNQTGEFYTWTSMDPDTKLYIDWQIGRQTREVGLKLMKNLSRRISGDVTITTDSLASYRDMIEHSFGARATHVVLKKKMKGSWNRETGDNRSIVFGITKSIRGKRVDAPFATTSHIERLHSTMRHFNPRLTRKTYRFSKSFDNHVYAHAIMAFEYNFCRQHKGLRGKHRGSTPAMAAGITKELWDHDRLLDEIDRFWKAKEDAPKTLADRARQQPVSGRSSKSYLVLHRRALHEAKVHAAACRLCRHGEGLVERPGKNPWYDFDDISEARNFARRIEPGRSSDCAMCMKEMQRGLRRRL